MIPTAYLRVYFIMGSQDCPGGTSPVDILKSATRGGITCFQFREKTSSLSMKETLALGRALRDECRQAHIPFIVNDRVDLALLLEADGVHVGQGDIPASEVRKLIGDDLWLGVSAHTAEEAEQAISEGADYLGVGPVFPTRSKEDTEPVLGLDGLASFCSKVGGKIPVVAIGGITSANASRVISSGADGIAVISAIASATEPQMAVKKLQQAVRNGLEGKKQNE